MSTRRVKIVLLCEDSQHEAFITRFLEGMGWNKRELRVEKNPSPRGSAEQWVRENFPKELKLYRLRKHRAASAVIAMIDADTRDRKVRKGRISDLEEACTAKGIPFRTSDEAVAIAVPKRNIETWIYYLNGESVDEEAVYPKLAAERGCKPAVTYLVRLCRSTGLKPDAPPALAAACEEYNVRIRPLI